MEGSPRIANLSVFSADKLSHQRKRQSPLGHRWSEQMSGKTLGAGPSLPRRNLEYQSPLAVHEGVEKHQPHQPLPPIPPGKEAGWCINTTGVILSWPREKSVRLNRHLLVSTYWVTGCYSISSKLDWHLEPCYSFTYWDQPGCGQLTVEHRPGQWTRAGGRGCLSGENACLVHSGRDTERRPTEQFIVGARVSSSETCVYTSSAQTSVMDGESWISFLPERDTTDRKEGTQGSHSVRGELEMTLWSQGLLHAHMDR